jgi:hypothetical protein
MKKLFALLLVAGLFTFASCGGDSKTNNATDTTSTEDTTSKPTTEPEKKPEEKPAADTTAKPAGGDSTVVDSVKKTDGETTDSTKK